MKNLFSKMSRLFVRKAHAMARTGISDPLKKFKYRVTIPGLPTTVGFSKVSGLKRDITTIEYNEGGYAHTHKLPGKEKVDPIVLERGVFFGDVDLYSLFKKTLTNTDVRTTVTIELLNLLGAVSQTWTLNEAWVKTWEGPDFDANADEVAIEKITFEFEHYLD